MPRAGFEPQTSFTDDIRKYNLAISVTSRDFAKSDKKFFNRKNVIVLLRYFWRKNQKQKITETLFNE